MNQTLEERQVEYELVTDYKLTKRIPVIIRVSCLHFAKLTKKLNKPFCSELSNVFSEVMLCLVKQIDGAVFGYYHTDTITIVALNSQKSNTDAWLGNNIQNMVSTAASIATYEFKGNELDISGKPIFRARTFCVPSNIEVINQLILSQGKCFANAVNMAAFNEIMKSASRKDASMILDNVDVEARINMLQEVYDISFDEYPEEYRLGVCAYQAPKMIKGFIENKWITDSSIRFNEKQDFLYGALSNGHDIFRTPTT